MLREYFQDGGPVMYLIFGAWVVVLAGIIDRLLYLLGTATRRPATSIRLMGKERGRDPACDLALREEELALRGLERIDSVSQIAVSLGLFGTVLGISRSFFAREGELGLAAPDVLASGLATALFTTVAGLIVFLTGQGFLIAWSEWLEHRKRIYQDLLEKSSS
jgi:biopolymer transport protein ExbB/TolQ